MLPQQSIDTPVVTAGRTLDQVADVYDVLSPLMTFYQEERLGRKAISLLRLRGGEHVLDIGCGTGTVAIGLARTLSSLSAEFRVSGVDAAPNMIRIARKKAAALPQVEFRVAAAERLPYADGCFDAVISTFFFHHINFELKQQVIREIGRVLKKSGRAVIVDVDTPTNFFGAWCAWCGYVLFRQDEIKENIDGKLRQAIAGGSFRSWRKLSTHLGYISVYQLEK